MSDRGYRSTRAAAIIRAHLARNGDFVPRVVARRSSTNRLRAVRGGNHRHLVGLALLAAGAMILYLKSRGIRAA